MAPRPLPEPLITNGKTMVYLIAVGVQFGLLNGLLPVLDNICVFCQTYDGHWRPTSSWAFRSL
eukprot:4893018-Amphidinium_carterae.3